MLIENFLLMIYLFHQISSSNLDDVLKHYNVEEIVKNANDGFGAYVCHQPSPLEPVNFRTMINTNLSFFSKNNPGLECKPEKNPCELERITGGDKECDCFGFTNKSDSVVELSDGFNITYRINTYSPSYVAYICGETVTVTCEMCIPTEHCVSMTIYTPGACLKCEGREPDTDNMTFCMLPSDINTTCFLQPDSRTCASSCPVGYLEESEKGAGLCVPEGGAGGAGDVPPLKPIPWGNIIAIIIAVVVFFVVVGAIAFACWKRKKSKDAYRSV